MTKHATPCVERVDYRIRVTGATPNDVMKAATSVCAGWAEPANRVKVKHRRGATFIRFYASCDPVFVDQIYFVLMSVICSHINEDLYDIFKLAQLEAVA